MATEPQTLDDELGKVLAACSTSNAWSTLEAVAKKVSKKIGRNVRPRELNDFMDAVGDEALRTSGVWRTSFGAKYMPIVLVNPAYARVFAQSEALGSSKIVCTCGLAPALKSGRDVKEDTKRYFGSHDYNAGRHASTASVHKPNCLMWKPSTTSHLHSWRRGY